MKHTQQLLPYGDQFVGHAVSKSTGSPCGTWLSDAGASIPTPINCRQAVPPLDYKR
ncbi:hypothetical protein GGR28_001081 [Lewinella aquimaris]|uniref:Uncharacterized protein n=1 Tax=Neolewinella aquimaris TaxID=1835722 RepID=A0A840E8T5_9BACT|nr:hypothetical protein [Neolewinella aquimaris]